MNCQNCKDGGGVVFIDFGKRLLCGFCFLAWAMDLVSEKKQSSYLDCVQKMKRVEQGRKVA